jgi:hypothetical protein
VTKRKNNYLADLQRRREEASTTAPASLKDPSVMTEAERKAEIMRLEREIRANEEEAVHLGREELSRQSRPASFGTIFKRARPYWK